MKGGLSRTTVTSSIPLALVVVVGAVLSFRSHTVLRQDRDMVVHTYQVIGAVRQTLLLTAEAETAQRGFVITGDPAFLVPYDKACNQLLPATLADLNRLLVTNTGQQQRLNRLRNLLQHKFEEVQSTIDIRRTKGFEAAQVLITSESDRREMDAIRSLVSEMDSVEESLLKQRAGHVTASERRILWVGALTAALSVAVRLSVAMRGKRSS